MLAISTSALVTALTLCATLTGVVRADDLGDPAPICTGYTRSQPGQDCPAIAQEFGLNLTPFEAMNPGLDCTTALPPYTKVCIHEQTPICTETVTVNTTSCDQLAVLTDVDLPHLHEFNSKLDKDCNNLHVGDTVCTMVSGCYKSRADGIICFG